MAEAELRRELAEKPGHAEPRALYAMCLAERGQLSEATAEARQAIGCDSESPYAHYVLARILHKRDRYPEAEEAIRLAIRLDPENAHFRALLAGLLLDQERWRDALAVAEQGLSLDPEDGTCANMRAMALTRLGRRAEAHATLVSALERDPEDAVSHANRGMAYLHEGKPHKALEHFREALRLDPQSDYARAGMIEALKARNPIYRLILAYFLWMSTLSGRVRWGVIIGAYVLVRILRVTASENPELQPYVYPIVAVYMLFALLSWMGVPFFNLTLLTSRFGRQALSREAKQGAIALGLLWSSALACAIAWWYLPSNPLIIAAIVMAMLSLPIGSTLSLAADSRRRKLIAFNLVLVLMGVGAIAVGASGGEVFNWMLGLFMITWVIYQWVHNAIVTGRPEPR